MSSQSQGSVSTALAAGSGIPTAKANKMKLDMPSRPAKSSSRRNPSAASGGDGGGDVNAAAANNAAHGGNNKDDGSVPHVVRVTFLGVAGLLANPLLQDGTASAADNINSGGASQSPSNESSQPITTLSPASSQHPSLLFPLPPHLRVVASVSRSRTARGIPSGMSKCLTPSSNNNNNNSGSNDQKSSQPPSMISSTNSSSSSNNRINIEEVSTTGDSSFNLAAPSQLLNSRTGSTHRSNAGGGRRSNKGRPDEGIEVIRPHSPSNDGTNGGVEKEDGQPGRFVAVWDETSKQFLKPSLTAAGTNNNSMQQKQQPSFVNLTNSLAFEAELRPSSSLVSKGLQEDRPSTPVASTTFAPKSFCVTLGLVPDFDHASMEGMERAQTPVLDDIGERQVSSQNLESGRVPPSAAPPMFAIPVGFADLVINGDETLDGRRRQIDLPLSSLANFMGAFGGSDEILEKGNYPFPLIELTAEGLASAANNNNESKKDAEPATTTATGKTKKKSIVKRMFSRKQQSSATAAASAGEPSRASSHPRVYSGTPRSVFQLDRPPNAKERTLFLERYGVDPAGDAVIRIGLEVFPRGSELEKIFRHKSKMRKKAAAAASAVGGSQFTAMGNRNRLSGRFSSSSASVGSRTLGSADSRSLMDEELLDSDYDDSDFSQSFFTLDSDASQTSWDESTMYTDALSSFNTTGDDSMSYTTGFTEYEKSKAGKKRTGAKQSPAGSFFTNLLNCHGPTACGDVNDEEEIDTSTQMTTMDPYANIDAVVSAVASMSMSEEEALIAIPAATTTSPTAKSLKSMASMETATRANNNNHRSTSPKIAKESGEEFTLDNMSPASGAGGASSISGSGSIPPSTSLDIIIPLEDRSVTVSNEKSPLALIQQRVGNDDAIDELVRESSNRQQYVDEGHEFTLEEHQSASM